MFLIYISILLLLGKVDIPIQKLHDETPKTFTFMNFKVVESILLDVVLVCSSYI